MGTLAENIQNLKSTLPEKVLLIAVSKFKSIDTIQEAWQCGQRVFGENKVQELAMKAPALPSDIEWHFIGHLQTNKVRLLIPHVSVIQSVDSLKLLKEINKEARKIDKTIPCLLQFHIAEEETKFGLNLTEARSLLQSEDFKAMKHVSIRGVMGMASFTSDKDQVNKEFATLRSLFNTLKEEFFPKDSSFRELSMGMSEDYPIALQHGSTMVRIGTAIFGDR